MNDQPKISIITIAFNNAADIEPTLRSVIEQDYPDIEYIVVDGASTDGTLDVIARYESDIDHVISEPDNGMYEAINKGISAATGDIFGLIHAGDQLYSRRVISKVAAKFLASEADVIYGHSVLVNSKGQAVRVNKSPGFSKKLVQRGWMPSHQSIYMKTPIVRENGAYRQDIGQNGDYEFFLRYFFKHDLHIERLDDFMIRFSLGGTSTTNYHRLWQRQKIHANCWRLNGINPPKTLIPMKLARKAPQFIRGIFWRLAESRK